MKKQKKQEGIRKSIKAVSEKLKQAGKFNYKRKEKKIAHIFTISKTKKNYFLKNKLK